MKALRKQKGFTLVELAIVLTIIGLLIGGILKGQQLMTNARVTATMSQVQAIDAATTTFRDTYSAVPGDMPSPNTRLTGFSTTTTGTSFGNGIVGKSNWDLKAVQASGTTVPTGVTAEGDETVLYWAELSAAGLLSGITYTGSGTSPTLGFGTTHPVARLGGGWVVGNADGNTNQAGGVPGGPTVVGRTYLSGTVLGLTDSPSANIGSAGGGTDVGDITTPSIASQIDRKQDDGNPMTGFIQAYGKGGASGAADSCYVNGAAPYTYNENVAGKNCGMFWRIQG